MGLLVYIFFQTLGISKVPTGYVFIMFITSQQIYNIDRTNINIIFKELLNKFTSLNI